MGRTLDNIALLRKVAPSGTETLRVRNASENQVILSNDDGSQTMGLSVTAAGTGRIILGSSSETLQVNGVLQANWLDYADDAAAAAGGIVPINAAYWNTTSLALVKRRT